MRINDVEVAGETERCILNLAIKTELNTGMRFNTTKSNDVLNLLKFAQQSQDKIIRDIFEKLSAYASPALRATLKSSGVSLHRSAQQEQVQRKAKDTRKTRVYRGQTVYEE